MVQLVYCCGDQIWTALNRNVQYELTLMDQVLADQWILQLDGIFPFSALENHDLFKEDVDEITKWQNSSASTYEDDFSRMRKLMESHSFSHGFRQDNLALEIVNNQSRSQSSMAVPFHYQGNGFVYDFDWAFSSLWID